MAFAPETHERIPNWLDFWVRDAGHRAGIFAESSWRYWRELQTVSEPPPGVWASMSPHSHTGIARAMLLVNVETRWQHSTYLQGLPGAEG